MATNDGASHPTRSGAVVRVLVMAGGELICPDMTPVGLMIEIVEPR